jgi:hypothetical protein
LKSGVEGTKQPFAFEMLTMTRRERIIYPHVPERVTAMTLSSLTAGSNKRTTRSRTSGCSFFNCASNATCVAGSVAHRANQFSASLAFPIYAREMMKNRRTEVKEGFDFADYLLAHLTGKA